MLRDVPKKQFPKGPSRFNTVVFSKDDLQDLKNMQSPGARAAVLRTFTDAMLLRGIAGQAGACTGMHVVVTRCSSPNRAL